MGSANSTFLFVVDRVIVVQRHWECSFCQKMKNEPIDFSEIASDSQLLKSMQNFSQNSARLEDHLNKRYNSILKKFDHRVEQNEISQTCKIFSKINYFIATAVLSIVIAFYLVQKNMKFAKYGLISITIITFSFLIFVDYFRISNL